MDQQQAITMMQDGLIYKALGWAIVTLFGIMIGLIVYIWQDRKRQIEIDRTERIKAEDKLQNQIAVLAKTITDVEKASEKHKYSYEELGKDIKILFRKNEEVSKQMIETNKQLLSVIRGGNEGNAGHSLKRAK